MNKSYPSCFLALATLALGLSFPAPAADVGLCVVVKGLYYDQTNATTAVPQAGTDFAEFNCFVTETAANSVTAASFRNPVNTLFNLVRDGQEWSYSVGYTSQAAMDAAFGSGNYTITISTAHDGNRSLTLTLLGDLYPPIPLVNNYDALQTMDPAQPFTLNWTFTGGTANDMVICQIWDWQTDEPVFSTPFPGQAGAYNGLSNSVVIPAGTLTAGRQYEISLDFIRPSDIELAAYPGAMGAAVYARGTSLQFTPGSSVTDTNAPWVESSYPWQHESLARNGNIAFVFSEPMATNISIIWSNAPYTFNYVWSADRTTLFVLNPAGFAANTTIGYVLNLTGTGFRDVAGNALQPYFGQVMIGEETVTPDVNEWVVGKGRVFEQTNATTVIPSRWEAPYYFFASANQNSFVMATNATLTRPGGAVTAMDFEGDGHDLDLEFADEASLNAAFPQGAYTITVNTIHDGTRMLPLTLPANNFPNAPRLSNYAAAQAIDPAQPFTLAWDAFTGGTANDFIMVEIRKIINDDYDEYVWESPDIGEPGQLNGLSNSVVIPAGTLTPGRKYEILIMFAKLVAVDTTTYPGARGLVAFTTETIVYGYTTGEPIKPKLQNLSYNAAGRFFQYTVTGEPGMVYTVEASEDLESWWPIITQNAWGGSFQGTDGNLWNDRRFYRVREGWPPMQP